MCAFSHICNVCVVFGWICFVSCLHVLCSTRWPSLSSFFVHVRLRSFGSMIPPFILTIPVLFLFILCCFPFEFLLVCFVSCLHVLCSSRWPSLPSFFCSCPAPVFRIYDPPVYSDHSCPVSLHLVLFSVYMYCVLYLAFLLLQSFFYLLSCLAPVFLSWLCISSCLLLYKRHLFYWIGRYQNKVHVTPSVPFHQKRVRIFLFVISVPYQ
jgi:hypothetical protein